MPEAEVIKYDLATWRAMLFVKNSINWYDAQKRDNDVYGTAKKKEKNLLRHMMENERLHA